MSTNSTPPLGDLRFVLESKVATARFYAGQLLPQAAGPLPMVTAGVSPLNDVPVGSLCGGARCTE
jgi:hypothetical protein